LDFYINILGLEFVSEEKDRYVLKMVKACF
jgi:hypothetical protein